MRLARIFHIFIILLIALASQAKAQSGPVCFEEFGADKITVLAVPDLHTVELSDGTSIHPIGFYAPTHGSEKWADRLHHQMRQLLNGTQVQVFHTSNKQDRHGRLPAYVALEGGYSLASELIAQGVALLAPTRNLPCLATLQFAERVAGSKRMDLWREGAVLRATDDRFASAIGHYATVRARVRSIGIREKRHYLNFGAKWREDFTVEIAPRTTQRLFGGAENLQKLDNQWVTVRGRLRNKGGPMIVLEQESQIDFTTDQQDKS